MIASTRPRRPPDRCGAAGFTLIELLVVLVSLQQLGMILHNLLRCSGMGWQRMCFVNL
jgi:hypothetical protein